MANQKTGTIQDAFTAATVDAQWTQTALGSATFSYTSTGASVVFPATTSSSTDGDLAFASGQVLDLTGSFVRLYVTSVSGAGATHTDNALRVRRNATNYVMIFYEAGTLFFSKVVTSAQTNIASVTYNATTHAWWQIRESNGITFWETSSDGMTWTTQTAQADPVTLSAVDILIGGLCFGVDTSPANFTFRGLNYPQYGTTTSTSSTSTSSTSTSATTFSTSSTSSSSSTSSTSTSSTSISISTSSTSTSVSTTSSSTSSTSSSTSSTSTSSTSSSTSVSSTSSSISSTSTSSTSTSSTSSSTSVSSTSSSISSTSSSISSTSASTSSTSVSTSSTSSSTSTTTLPPPYFNYTYQDSAGYQTTSLNQDTTGSGTAPTVNVAWSNNTISGNTILIAVADFVTASNVTSITDSQSNVYSRIAKGSTVSTPNTEFWYAMNIIGGTTPTVTLTLTGSSSVDVTMQEWSGLAYLDQYGISTSGSTTSANASSSTYGSTNFINELVVGWAMNNGPTTFTTPTGYSNITQGGVQDQVAIASKISPYAQTESVLFPIGLNERWVCGLATFVQKAPVNTVTDLSNKFTSVTYGNVSGDDGDYFIERGSRFLIQEYKSKHQNNSDSIIFTWKGRSTLSTLISPILIQIYNVNSAAWETLAVTNTVPADTDFTSKVTQTANLSNYYDTTNTVSFRSYQLVV